MNLQRPESECNRRAVLGAAAGALAAAGCASVARTAGPDAVVGVGGFATVQAALDAAPKHASTPHRIMVRAGRWREKLTIDKPNIHLIGEGPGVSVIEYDTAAGLTAPDGRRWGTFRSASLTVTAPGCVLRDLSVDNSFDYLGARADPDHPAGRGLQAVALAVMNGADRTLLDNVSMASWQDTLLVNAGRTLLRNCEVSGAVDYIFGAGVAFFEGGRIITRGRPGNEGARLGYVTAPSTLLGNPYGLIFDGCRLEKTDGMPAGVIALGRPWRPTTTFADGRYGHPDAVGQAVFLRCWMDEHIDPEGWDRMAYGTKDGERGWTEPEVARFFEFESSGPGAHRSMKRRQLTAEQAQAYTRKRVLGGWEVQA